ncbi:MAG: phosphotransferase, partial [Bacilli bacterium]|nr:phosphotransferase [Bacilli bacterium]
MEDKILKVIDAYKKTDNKKILYRLLGGMSNYMYLVEIDGSLYTVRYPGEYCEHFVNRDLEENGIMLFEKLGLTNKTVYFNKEDGTKISSYTEGFALSDLKRSGKALPYEKASELLKKVHNSNLKAVNDYNPFLRLENYEKDLVELGFVIPKNYINAKKDFLEFKEYLESQKKVLCHNDSQPSNFVLSNDGSLLIVDFEFTGNNDLIYDIACFANMELSDGEKLLEVYFDHNVKNDEYKRFYLWRSYQAFQWYNVA